MEKSGPMRNKNSNQSDGHGDDDGGGTGARVRYCPLDIHYTQGGFSKRRHQPVYSTHAPRSHSKTITIYYSKICCGSIAATIDHPS